MILKNKTVFFIQNNIKYRHEIKLGITVTWTRLICNYCILPEFMHNVHQIPLSISILILLVKLRRNTSRAIATLFTLNDPYFPQPARFQFSISCSNNHSYFYSMLILMAMRPETICNNMCSLYEYCGAHDLHWGMYIPRENLKWPPNSFIVNNFALNQVPCRIVASVVCC